VNAISSGKEGGFSICIPLGKAIAQRGGWSVFGVAQGI
jgi:hypothetical protein